MSDFCPSHYKNCDDAHEKVDRLEAENARLKAALYGLRQPLNFYDNHQR